MSDEQKEKREAHKREAKRFSFVGVLATLVDYVILNIGHLVFHLPLMGVNILSTSTASIVSYKLNKQIVFEGQRHNRKKTIILYVVIIGCSIYIIQNLMLYLVGHRFGMPTYVALEALERIGLPQINEQFVSTNLSKICASLAGAVWNFAMLRKYVFIPESHVIDKKHAQL